MESTSATLPPPAPVAAPRSDTKPDVKQPHLWNVVLLDDAEHSYEYVIELAIKLFRHPPQKAMQIAKTVDTQGRAVLLTVHRELAELKQEQVHAFGPDRLIATCAGSMSAIIEPAYADENDDAADHTA
jgi:ATP-dependent Clp protease adaptor protein ClpS